jgi:hypothetical protein
MKKIFVRTLRFNIYLIGIVLLKKDRFIIASMKPQLRPLVSPLSFAKKILNEKVI